VTTHQVELLRIVPALERKQIDRLQAVCARREGALVEAALTALRADAATDRNLMPSLLDANATGGEIVAPSKQCSAPTPRRPSSEAGSEFARAGA